MAALKTETWRKIWKVFLIVLNVLCIGYTIYISTKSDSPTEVYMTSLFTGLLFILSLWCVTHSYIGILKTTIERLHGEVEENTIRLDAVDEAEVRLRTEYEKVISILMRFGEIEQSIHKVALLGQKIPILDEYLVWIHHRYHELLRLPSEGVIEAPDPDYFGFAAMFLHKAKKSIRSTS